jgi:putative nucleotidyltransferase with HDIG domain
MPEALPRWGRLYVACVVLGGGVAIVHAVSDLRASAISYEWLIIAALTLLGGSLSIRIPSSPTTISVSEALVFTSALLYGPGPATLTVALDGLIVSLWGTSKRLDRMLFNIAEPAISVNLSAHLFYALAQISPLELSPVPSSELLFPLIAFAATYFMLNGCFMGVAVTMESDTTPVEFLKTHVVHLSLNYFGSVVVAILLVQNVRQVNLSAWVVIAPLMVLSYVTSKTSMARVEDAHRHLAALNELYLSTIETLAMAVDAKDQITHGHIRRVQMYAVALARRLGVHDSKEIKAIEASALLHDLGKLAIPEHILNKPGPLTKGEFEQMKLHATIGANILSKINFPYPVVPIVRHHHESWDGSGYPDGLTRESIPLGARILAVVDCFDALTSDRPYRRALNDEEAAKILKVRSGSMYDPKVVEAFLAMHAQLSEEERAPGHNPLVDVVNAWETVPGRVAQPGPQVTDGQLAEMIMGPAADRIRSIGQRLESLFPTAQCALYVPDGDGMHLRQVFVSQRAPEGMRDLSFVFGERLTGWVAANRQSVMNSDPALDLDPATVAGPPPLLSTLSVPVIRDGNLVGVITVYSTVAQHFGNREREMIEEAATRMAPLIDSTRQSPALVPPRAPGRAVPFSAEIRNRGQAGA